MAAMRAFVLRGARRRGCARGGGRAVGEPREPSRGHAGWRGFDRYQRAAGLFGFVTSIGLFVVSGIGWEPFGKPVDFGILPPSGCCSSSTSCACCAG
jgi:hypothetical protein